jgi:tRNA1Val (adenine37-N6)-methyltransferase
MSNPYFRFKQFTVWHHQCAMRVNTDGVLLGAWADVQKAEKVLDIGTGTGIIALMLAQRCNALIHAVEIEENAWKQAVYNAENSRWADRIRIFHEDFTQYDKNCSSLYDSIVSNPPYFSNSLKNPGKHKTLARHNDALPFSTLIRGVKSLLKEKGIFSVILPAPTSEFESEAFITGLNCIRKTFIRSLPDKPVSRVLLEFSADLSLKPQIEELLIFDCPGVYSEAYMHLTREFYLKF